jgi:hypothetical protein
MSADRDDNLASPSTSPSESDVDEARRQAMVRFAKYSAPTLLAILLSGEAMATAVSGGDD